MGGDWLLRGYGLKFLYHILDGRFSHILSYNSKFCFKRQKIYEKEAGDLYSLARVNIFNRLSKFFHWRAIPKKNK